MQVARLESERPFPLLEARLQAQAISVGEAPGSVRAQALVDELGQLSLVLMDLPGRSGAEYLLAPLLAVVLSTLDRQAPLHGVVFELQQHLRRQSPTPVALGILRFNPAEHSMEVLNAGLPPMACVDSTGQLVLHPATSSPIGLLPNDTHSYKLMPMTAGSTWFALSEGVLQGGNARNSSPQTLISELHLERWGSHLCAAPLEESRRLVSGALWRSQLTPEDGACLVAHLPGPGKYMKDIATTRPPRKTTPRP